MPVTQDGDKLAGQGDMGGLWEWTSSALEKQDGFEPMKLYPAYSSKLLAISHLPTWQAGTDMATADFYDDKKSLLTFFGEVSTGTSATTSTLGLARDW